MAIGECRYAIAPNSYRYPHIITLLWLKYPNSALYHTCHASSKNWYFSLSIYIYTLSRCLPEPLFIAARVRTSSLVNVPMYTAIFPAISYKLPYHKCQSKRMCAHFWTHLSRETLTRMPHLEWGTCFCVIYAHCTQLQQKSTKWALHCHVKLSVDRALEWFVQNPVNVGVFLVA